MTQINDISMSLKYSAGYHIFTLVIEFLYQVVYTYSTSYVPKWHIMYAGIFQTKYLKIYQQRSRKLFQRVFHIKNGTIKMVSNNIDANDNDATVKQTLTQLISIINMSPKIMKKC